MILFEPRNLSQGKGERSSSWVKSALSSPGKFVFLLVPLPWMLPVPVWLDSPCSSMDGYIKCPRFVWGELLTSNVSHFLAHQRDDEKRLLVVTMKIQLQSMREKAI